MIIEDLERPKWAEFGANLLIILIICRCEYWGRLHADKMSTKLIQIWIGRLDISTDCGAFEVGV